MLFGGTSLFTMACEPTTAPSPTTTPGNRIAFAPMLAPFLTIGPTSLNSFWHTYLSLANTQHGPKKTPSSTVEYVQMYTPVCIETFEPIFDFPSTTTFVPNLVLLPTTTSSRNMTL